MLVRSKHVLSQVLTLRRIKLRLFYSSTHDNQSKQTHFGFQQIAEADKEIKVHQVFANVAGNYDRMNDAMSMGIHRIWKDIFMLRLCPTQDTRLLDVAGGTGDIALRFLAYMKHYEAHSAHHVTVCDINRLMLDAGERRSKAAKCDTERIRWVEGNAEQLPFADNAFTAYTIAFGIRNVTHIDSALREAYRVLQPGGRFLCLEFATLPNMAAQWIYDQYSMKVIPVLGHIVAGQWEAYQYLVESIRRFPQQAEFAQMIEEAGFRRVTYENLSFGIVAIHSAFKI